LPAFAAETGLYAPRNQGYVGALDYIGRTLMASITIRDLDDQTTKRLRVRAARHKRSIEEEARDILRTALAGRTDSPRNLAQAVRRRFEPLGGIELEVPVRQMPRESELLAKRPRVGVFRGPGGGTAWKIGEFPDLPSATDPRRSS